MACGVCEIVLLVIRWFPCTQKRQPKPKRNAAKSASLVSRWSESKNVFILRHDASAWYDTYHLSWAGGQCHDATYEGVTARECVTDAWWSHLQIVNTQISTSRCEYEWVKSNTDTPALQSIPKWMVRREIKRQHKRMIEVTDICHFTLLNESCYIYERAMSHMYRYLCAFMCVQRLMYTNTCWRKYMRVCVRAHTHPQIPTHTNTRKYTVNHTLVHISCINIHTHTNTDSLWMNAHIVFCSTLSMRQQTIVSSALPA